MTIAVGRPLAAAAPMPEETRPSIPLAPRLERKRASRRGGRQEGLLVADRHARGGVDEVAVAMRGAERELQARLGDRPVAGELGRDRLAPRRRRPGARARAYSRSPRSTRAAQPAASSVGSARRIAAARRVGSFQPPCGSTTIWSAPEAASHSRSGLLVGISPKRRTRSGVERLRKCSSRSSRS